jgi:hypothetical protein
MLELFECGQASGWAVDVLVRAQHNRVLPGGKQAGKLWQQVQASAALGCVYFEMPAGRGRKARPARQDIKVQRVQLKAAKAEQEAIWMTCVIATEINAPKALAQWCGAC